eukprot:8580693-Pyramimonas_sp.AAC.1
MTQSVQLQLQLQLQFVRPHLREAAVGLRLGALRPGAVVDGIVDGGDVKGRPPRPPGVPQRHLFMREQRAVLLCRPVVCGVDVKNTCERERYVTLFFFVFLRTRADNT